MERHGGIGYEHVLALDAPVLQMVEEVDDVLLPPLVLQEQAIFLEIPEVPRCSSVVCAVQPTDFEQVLDVPVLNIDHDDHMFSRFVEQLSQSTPEVQVDRVQQRFGEQIADLTVHNEPVHQRNVEHVVDVHDPLASVSERNEEQVVDVHEPHGAPGVAHAQQLTSRAAAAWLDAPQVHSELFFHTFPRPQKSAKGTGQSSAELVSHSSPSTSSAYGQSTWIDVDVAWTRCDVLGDPQHELLPVAPAVGAPAVLELGCTRSRAWHPLVPSRVPLPVLQGRIKILEYSCCCLS